GRNARRRRQLQVRRREAQTPPAARPPGDDAGDRVAMPEKLIRPLHVALNKQGPDVGAADDLGTELDRRYDVQGKPFLAADFGQAPRAGCPRPGDPRAPQLSVAAMDAVERPDGRNHARSPIGLDIHSRNTNFGRQYPPEPVSSPARRPSTV